MTTSSFRPRRSRWCLIACLAALVLLSACGGSSDSASEANSSGSGTDPAPGIVNLDDADLLIEDLRVDPELQAELSAELAIQLDLSSADADCLAREIDVEDLLAMSASDADENALERILTAFDSCEVPRSVFDR